MTEKVESGISKCENFTKNKFLKKSLYVLHGKIIHGAGRGKKVGMPTANLKIDDSMSLPPCGVYSTIVTLGNFQYLGVTNIGVKPSVCDDNLITVETYILDFSKNIYGEEIEIYFYKYLRSEKKFSCLEEVKNQVLKDSQLTRLFIQKLFPGKF